MKLKLTKKLEAEILKAYNEYWDAYLKGDMQTMSYWMHDNIQMIGSGRGEFFENKKKTIKYYKSTADQVAGKADMRNRKINVMPVGDQILVNEECDFFVLIDSTWTFYEEGRISTLFTKTNKGWKIIQEHGSMPDARTAEGEQVNTDKIKAENVRLKDAVKRRTIELEEKNRELEIETALEKVRARTMAMQKSDELPETSYLLFEQFKKLGANADQITIGVFNKEEGVFEMSATVYGSKIHETHKVPMDEPIVMNKIYTAWKKAKQKSSVLEIAGKELKAYNIFRNKTLGKKYFPEKITAIDRWIVNAAFFSKGVLSFSTITPAPQDTLQLLERFASVFDLTYTRFLDLKKAEAQTREAEVELSLERVRAKTMAMQKSEELQETTLVLFQQFKALGATTAQVSICIFDDETKMGEMFVTLRGEKIDRSFPMEIEKESFVMKKAKKTFLNKQKTFSITIKGKELQNYNRWRNSLVGRKGWDESDAVRKRSWYVDAVFFSRGMMGISSDIAPAAETLKLLERFATVFDLTFTRFLDLKKAEAQARESQIEAALERVRSKTMGMQKSDELAETAALLFKQINDLGIQPWTSGFNIWEKDDTSFIGYNPTPSGGITPPYHIPSKEDGFFKNIYEAKKRGADFFVFESAGKSLAKTYDYMKTLPVVKEVLLGIEKSGIQLPTFQINHCAFFSHGFLLFITLDAHEKAHDIFKRFAKVFEQTYTRFLDLQKAEAQTREAQIEAALERVRSRTMGMQKSEELKEVIQVVYDQFVHLNILVEHTGFIMDYKVRDDMHMWLADRHEVPSEVTIPYFDSPPNNSIKEAKERGLDFFTYHLTFEEKNKFYRDLFKIIPDVPEESLEYYFNCPGLAGSGVLLDNIGLYIENFSGTPYTNEENNTLMRFGKVFQQTYTRFLDLQKAEAQAREAKIENALEKVRSRTMAMQRSDELSETAAVLFQEFKKLGEEDLLQITIGIYNEAEGLIEFNVTSWAGGGEQINRPFILSIEEPTLLKPVFTAWKQQKKSIVVDLSGQQLEDWLKYRNANSGITVRSEDTGGRRVVSVAFFSKGHISFSSSEPRSPEAIQLLERFAGVFDLTYTRFLDLKNAEAQAREAQIELGLERVRARAMAMQKSNELSELVDTVFKELTKLDFALTWCIINIIDEPSLSNTVWAANPDINMPPESYHMLFEDYPFHHAMMKGWKERKTKYVYTLEGQEKKIYDEYLFNETEFRKVPEAAQAASKAMEKYVVTFSFSNFGGLQTVGNTPLSDSNLDILNRFGKVFDLTYTRFNDLKQAEAQAREAKIEAALERVRSRSLAMHKSDELLDVVKSVFDRLDELHVELNSAIIIIFSENSKDMVWWLINRMDEKFSRVVVKYQDLTYFRDLYAIKEKGQELLTKTYPAAKKLELFNYLFEQTDFKNVPEERKQFILGSEYFTISTALAKNTAIQITSYSQNSFSNNENEMLKKFVKVFDQSYTRFLDLQKAEAQAREAKIEAALERVRSRTMAMHQTSELQEVIHTVHNELLNLDLSIDGGSFVVINDDVGPELRCWGSGGTANTSEEVQVPHFNMPFCTNLMKGIKKGPGFFTEEFSQKEKEKYFTKLFEHKPWSDLSGEQKKETLSSSGGYTRSVAVSKYTSIFIINHQGRKFTEAENDILKRFAKVFEQTYTRFLDLKKAEANAREAIIEAALERVRGKAMAMHNSKDLGETLNVFYRELKSLSVIPIRCGVALMHKDTRLAELTTMNTTEQGDSIEIVGQIKMTGHPVLDGVFENWLMQKEFHAVLRGNQIKEYYQVLKPQISYLDYSHDEVQFGYYFMFNEGDVYAWTEKELTEDELTIYRRFTTVISLTYKRYKDLKDAEARAKEAIKQATLDRIRADIASMRSVADLNRITPLIWNELTILGIPFIRCGVFIMDDSQQLMHTFLSTPDGKAIAAFHIPYDIPGNVSQILTHWHKKEKYLDHWDEEAFTEFAYTMVKQGALASPEQYLKTLPKGGFYLHFLPFLQGMLYVGNTTQLNEEEIELIQHVADAFSTAYARYEDFNKLEAAKQQVDKTLTDLKQAQQQLVQSEKMASLGELTAGIAHEIQNPLNFVNNFSEVSNELIDEMNIEIEKGDMEEAKAIANDIKQNLEKINHHGKRADGIVKSMLQHSRSSSGKKEPTDINALADEYLRLSYHGLRAKDKSFNAKFEMDLDKSIDKINIISQDVGRVILNLINNAFYAVSEKKKQVGDGYDPTVRVATKNLGDKVEVRVIDNGNGIPQKVLEKIFQPFFTTKPTGQGTGLGLSLSYDIITKGHSGELKVETKEGEGSEFIIQLPNN